MLRKKITTVGNSAALLLSQDLMRIMDVAVGDEVEVSFVDRTMVIRPVAEEKKRKKVNAAVDRVFKSRKRLLRRLAE